MVQPVSTYYHSLNVFHRLTQTGLEICWFINLIIVVILLVALAIGYGFKVPRSRDIVDKVVLICNIITMMILSVMGLILSIQRFQVGLLSSNINAYGTPPLITAICFAEGDERAFLANFPLMYGRLMGGFAIFILVVALLIFICAILELVMQLFKRSYIEGSQSAASSQYL